MSTESLATFVSLQRQLRKKNSFAEAAFFMAHQTYKIFNYERAIVWSSIDEHDINLLAVTGVTQLEKTAPFYQDVCNIIKFLIKELKGKDSGQISTWRYTDFPVAIQESWPHGSLEQELVVTIFSNREMIIGGMITAHKEPVAEKNLEWLSWISESYQYCWCYLAKTLGLRYRISRFCMQKKVFIPALLILVMLLFVIKVPLSVVAPAVITAKDPLIITAPIDGVVDEIKVLPNQPVKSGQLLFEMKKQDLTNAKDVAQKELNIAQAKYLRSIQNSFKDVRERAEINILKAQIKSKEQDLAYTAQLLSRADIQSPEEGVAVLDDPEGWTGRPVVTGEKILEIANPDQVKIDIWLPATDDIEVKPGNMVKLFLNNAPLTTIYATVAYSSVNAEINAAGVLAYRVVANLEQTNNLPKIGSQGHAKLIKDIKVSLFYYFFRKPISALRQFFAW